MTNFTLTLPVPHEVKLVDLMEAAIELNSVMRADNEGVYLKHKNGRYITRIVINPPLGTPT